MTKAIPFSFPQLDCQNNIMHSSEFIGLRLAVLACIVPSGPFVNKMLLHAWIFHALCAHRAHWRYTSTRSHADVNQRLAHTQHRTQSARELPCFPNALIKRKGLPCRTRLCRFTQILLIENCFLNYWIDIRVCMCLFGMMIKI